MNAYRGKHISTASRRPAPSFRRGRHQVRNRHGRRWLIIVLALVLAGCFGAPPWKYGVLGYAVQACLSFSVCLVAPMFWVVLGLSLAAPPGQQSGTA